MDDIEEGKRLYRQHRWEQALAEFLRADIDGNDTEASVEVAYYLGLCYTKLERYDDALLYLEQVVTNDRDAMRTCQCRLALAYIYAITRRSRLAEFELRQLTSKGFESVQIYATLGFAAFNQRKIDEAVDWYGKALKLDRENPNALNGLGFILCDAERDPGKGLSLCMKAVEIRPSNPAYLDSVGWAYYKNNNIPQARTWLRRALDMAPKKEEIVSHMKLVLGEAPR